MSQLPAPDSRTHQAIGLTRTRAVWSALGIAMTAVGGMLWMLDGGSRLPRADGATLPALAGLTDSPLAKVFQTRVPMEPGRWDAIVIHHSGTPVGSPARLLSLDGVDSATAFHFVIGNGLGMDDGELNIGPAWLDQLPGLHVVGERADELNSKAIGICLVGNGDRRAFTSHQMARLQQLVSELCVRLGIPADRVLLHSDVAPTTDPGRRFDSSCLPARRS